MIEVRRLEAADAALLGRLTDLVNDVYAVAESGLWRPGRMRATASDLGDDVRAGELAIAARHGEVVGCIRVYDVSGDTSAFGMLAVAPEHRGAGVGRALVDFAEARTRERGRRAIQLELLVPRTWSHPNKELLKAWYARRGYRLVRSGTMEAAYPHLARDLVTPCDLEVHEKPLARAPARTDTA